MNSLPRYYASPMHLPFNRTCLSEQFVLQGPSADPGGPGYGVLLCGSKMLVAKDQGCMVLPYGEWPGEPTLFLGRWLGRPCRLINLSDAKELPKNLEMLELLEAEPQLPIDLFSLGGMGRMILHWQERSRFCGYCGQPTSWQASGWGRVCNSCRAPHTFPAIHPCAIVLVTRPGEVLLARKSNWITNRFSLIAGFQEFGESLEETATREVAEETGIEIGNVRYIGSQCWPFPSQVMVGFVADYVAGEIQLDKAELEEACWFPVDNLPELPPKRSVARYILDKTLDLP